MSSNQTSYEFLLKVNKNFFDRPIDRGTYAQIQMFLDTQPNLRYPIHQKLN